jgi:hypothetical protein
MIIMFNEKIKVYMIDVLLTKLTIKTFYERIMYL